MPTTGIINGSDFLVYIENTAILHSTSHTLSVTMATRDATTKSNSGWRSKLGGLRDWNVQAEGLLALDASYGYSQLFAIMTARTPVTVAFSTDEAGDDYWGGEALLTSLTLTAPMEENGTYSATFESAGSLTEYTVT